MSFSVESPLPLSSTVFCLPFSSVALLGNALDSRLCPEASGPDCPRLLGSEIPLLSPSLSLAPAFLACKCK